MENSFSETARLFIAKLTKNKTSKRKNFLYQFFQDTNRGYYQSKKTQRYKTSLTNLRLLQPANSARKISSHMKTAFPLLMKSFLNSPFVHRENYQWEKSSCGSLTVR